MPIAVWQILFGRRHKNHNVGKFTAFSVSLQSPKAPAYLKSLRLHCPFQHSVSSVSSNKGFCYHTRYQSSADSNLYDHVLQGVITMQGMKHSLIFQLSIASKRL